MGSLSSVGAQVAYQTGSMRKAARADVAFMWSLAGVDAQVAYQMGFL